MRVFLTVFAICVCLLQSVPVTAQSEVGSAGISDCIATSTQTLPIHPALPEYRFEISARLSRVENGMRGGIQKIDVFRTDSPSRLQTIYVLEKTDDRMLMIEGTDCSTAKPLLHDPDINFDGYRDLAVIVSWGDKFTRMKYWMYSPATKRFISNELTKQLGKLDEVQFDPQDKTVYSTYVGPEEPSITAYRITNGALVFKYREFLDTEGFLIREEHVGKVRKVVNRYKPSKEEEARFWGLINDPIVE